eukprot:scaffold307958_cov34-Prasinocladus_malaysianus.AAC.1
MLDLAFARSVYRNAILPLVLCAYLQRLACLSKSSLSMRHIQIKRTEPGDSPMGCGRAKNAAIAA